MALRLRPGSQIVIVFQRRGSRLESVSAIGGGYMPLRSERQDLERLIAIEDV